MKYSISNVYLYVNNCPILIGKVLGPEDDPYSLEATEIITNSEFASRLKSFECGYGKLDDCILHTVGSLYTKDYTGEKTKTITVEPKWINELKLMGYEVDKLDYTLKENE